MVNSNSTLEKYRLESTLSTVVRTLKLDIYSLCLEGFKDVFSIFIPIHIFVSVYFHYSRIKKCRALVIAKVIFSVENPHFVKSTLDFTLLIWHSLSIRAE